MDKALSIITAIVTMLPFLGRKPEKLDQIRRNRRYRKLKKLRDRRDKEKISAERYAEDLAEIERRFKK